MDISVTSIVGISSLLDEVDEVLASSSSESFPLTPPVSEQLPLRTHFGDRNVTTPVHRSDAICQTQAAPRHISSYLMSVQASFDSLELHSVRSLHFGPQ